MNKYGLIGKTLKHSFSKIYFNNKFTREGISDSQYELFELDSISEFNDLIKSQGKELHGLNVTIPYKLEVMSFLDEIDPIASRIGAVNVIKVISDKLIGFNSDYYGFRSSLEKWLSNREVSALILGTGGASNAVKITLEDLRIPYRYVSRTQSTRTFTYEDLKNNPQIVANHKLVINCTPLGTFPEIELKPDIPYSSIGKDHFLYDLVYNPEKTAFLQSGLDQGAQIHNGLSMLQLQAEKSWEIWNSDS